MIHVYSYAKCSTCRNALKWLEARGVEYEVSEIKESPPHEEHLSLMLSHQGGVLRKLFNTSGMDYRALELKDKLPSMSQQEAFKLLQSNGMLVKRPFLISEELGLVGFKEQEWQSVFGED